MWFTYDEHKAIGRALMCERGQHNWKPVYRYRPLTGAQFAILPVIIVLAGVDPRKVVWHPLGTVACTCCGARRQA